MRFICKTEHILKYGKVFLGNDNKVTEGTGIATKMTGGTATYTAKAVCTVCNKVLEKRHGHQPKAGDYPCVGFTKAKSRYLQMPAFYYICHIAV